MIKLNVDHEISEKATEILTYADVDFVDGEDDSSPVKKVTIEINANNIACVTDERYVCDKTKDGKEIFTTTGEEGKEAFLTQKESYCIVKGDEDVVLNLVRIDEDVVLNLVRIVEG